MPTLPITTLGKTGLRVTNLCLGGAPLGNMPETFAYAVPEERALATVRALLDSPINFIDTAASYGDGEGERRDRYRHQGARRLAHRVRARNEGRPRSAHR